MEALVLAGLLGAGYLINKEEEDKNPITTPAKKEITVSYWPIIADPICFHISFDTHIIQRLVAEIIYVFCRNDFDLPPWSNSERCQACERLALNSCGSGIPKNYLF